MTEKQVEVLKTLPYRYYVDETIFEEEREKIFLKKWLLVGHTSQVAKPGDFFTFEIAGESVLISCSPEGEVHAHYNVCPHRGARVEKGKEGNKKVFLCSYHGWTFKLDGKVNRTPNFDKEQLGTHNCMTRVNMKIFQSLIFINFDENAVPFEEEYADLVKSLEQYDFFGSLKKVRQKERVIEANWKAVIDNYLECDHCKIAHPAFSKTFDMENYQIDNYDTFTCQYSKMKQGEQSDPAFFYWVYPNIMISIYPGEEASITTSQIIPIAPDRSLAIYTYYFQTDELTEKQEELIAFVDQVREEDFEIVELLQKGFDSKAFENGIYSPTENGLVQFHEQYRESLGKN